MPRGVAALFYLLVHGQFVQSTRYQGRVAPLHRIGFSGHFPFQQSAGLMVGVEGAALPGRPWSWPVDLCAGGRWRGRGCGCQHSVRVVAEQLQALRGVEEGGGPLAVSEEHLEGGQGVLGGAVHVVDGGLGTGGGEVQDGKER